MTDFKSFLNDLFEMAGRAGGRTSTFGSLPQMAETAWARPELELGIPFCLHLGGRAGPSTGTASCLVGT